MAKKTSAASKGYRKNVKKKPFLTKKEIIALIVIVAVIVLAVVLFNVLYNPYISAKDVQSNDIITFASASTKDKYVRLGSVTDLDGYTRESSISTESPVGSNSYTPVDESSPMTYFSVSGAVVSPASMIDYMYSYYNPFADSISDVIETEVDGHTAYICSFTMSDYVEEEAAEDGEASTTDETVETETPAADETAEAEAPATDDAAEEEAEPEPNTFYQNISMYIAADDSHSIGVNAYHKGSDDSYYLSDDEIEAYMLNLAQVIVFPEK
ncbi:MAG: hypothetical protein Q4G06_12380 [Clostridia bacterium]|nr:hypothetical protein [Clostridia bacterium]